MSRAPSDTPKSTPAYHLAEGALKAYAQVLDTFLNDEHQGEQMVLDQGERMHRWGGKLLSYKPDQKYPPLMKEKILVKGKLHPMIVTRLNENKSHLYGRTQSVPLHIMRQGSGAVYNDLKDKLGLAYELLKDGVDLTALSEAVKIHAANALRPYSDSRVETKQLFEAMDAWFAWGQEFAIQTDDAKGRLHNTLLIPQELTRAKWQFMVTLANAIYDIGLGEGRKGNGDARDLTLISRMMERLSRHERGGDNPHMPPNCKLLHNPAIHSIHVVALTKKMFDIARDELEKSLDNGTRSEALNYLEVLRHDVMRAALLHDMGEMNGEISQGLLVSQMSEDDKKIFGRQRDAIEPIVFMEHLDEIATKPDANGRSLYDEDKWRGNKAITGKRTEFEHLFELAERTNTFAGRLLKTLERMQSQQDYIRFQHLLTDPDYPTLSEPPIRKSEIARMRAEATEKDRIEGGTVHQDAVEVEIKDVTDKNRDFSLNYVADVLMDNRKKKENDATIRTPGEDRLSELAKQGGTIEQKVQTALLKAVENEHEHLITELTAEFDKKPDARVSGASAPTLLYKAAASPDR